MKIERMIPTVGSLLLGTALLTGCSEPDQPAAVSGSPPGEGVPAALPAPAAAVELTAPVELSLEERRQPMTAETSCNLERVNKIVFTGSVIEISKSGGEVRVSGWVADQVARGVPASADVRMVGVQDNRAWKLGVKTGVARGDVVKLLGGEGAYINAGYGVSADFSAMPTGSYRMYTVFNGSDGLKVCDNGRSITLTD